MLATFLGSICAIFLACIPFHKYWQISPDPGSMLFRSQSLRFAVADSWLSRFLPSRCLVAHRLDVLCRKRLHRHLLDIDPHSSVMGVNSTPGQEDCVDYRARGRYLRLGLCDPEERFCSCGMFHPESSIIRLELCAFSDMCLGPCQRCRACRKVGDTRDLRCSSHDEPSHDLPAHQNVDEVPLAQHLTLLQEF